MQRIKLVQLAMCLPNVTVLLLTGKKSWAEGSNKDSEI